jgi:hypothetical protein
MQQRRRLDKDASSRRQRLPDLLHRALKLGRFVRVKDYFVDNFFY